MDKNKIVKVYVEYYNHHTKEHFRGELDIPLKETIDNYCMSDYVSQHHANGRRVRINHYHIIKKGITELFNKKSDWLTVRKYAIPIKKDEGLFEKHFIRNARETFEKLAGIEQLKDIDFNGHFGYFLFVSMEISDDTPETWGKINSVVGDFIELAP